ncbi:MAG: 30S ribosome-binding factor RbfA [Actinomycetota bacterium]|nr:30S ribosome-binding factor RbfA [Actinomycetota bacterium]
MARKRKPRLEQAVREAVAELLDEEIADPRVEHVTITDARVSEDQRHATVYYTTLDQDLIAGDQAGISSDVRSPQEAHEGLLSAAPRLQGLLARRVRMRHTPTIAFEPDQIAAEARRIDELLRGARSSNPGGDVSPYRSLRDAAEEAGETT